MSHSNEKDSDNLIENRRKDCRKEFTYAVLEFVIHPDTAYEIFVGYTLNVSECGMCLYTSARLKTGQQIILKCDNPRIYRKAVVRWIERYDSFFHRVGVEFV